MFSLVQIHISYYKKKDFCKFYVVLFFKNIRVVVIRTMINFK